MALVGEMQYLTIGDSTYSLPIGGGGSGSVTSVGVSNATNGGLTVSGSPVTSSGSITIGHSNVLTSAQTTSGVYPIKIDKNGHISEYGSAVTIPSITLNGSSTTSPSFYAPTGAGTNGYILKSSGSGAPTWTSAVLTDENLKWTASTTSNTYYPLASTSTATTSTANTLNGINFYQYYNTAGGYRRLDLGNSTAYKSTGGAYGTIRLYGAAATYYGDLVPGILGTTSGDGHISANRTWTLPDKTGTIALTSDIPTVPTITLNGSSSTSPSFYAPTGAGTSGYVLQSNGSGAPTWTGAVLTDEKLKTEEAGNSSGYLIIGNGTNVAETKKYSTKFEIDVDSSDGEATLYIGDTSTVEGSITFYNGTNSYTTHLYPQVNTKGVSIALPSSSGTIALTTDIPTSASDIGAATSDHVHGNITNGGDITATAPTIANGDQIIINDSSASKITNGPTFDGSTTTKALTQKGTWETFATSNTNTTYSLSNALSSHKFTETLTAGGSGSGTSTATMEFVAGTGITLTDDTSNKKITIASSVTNTDENVKSTAVTSATTNYLVGSTTSTTTTGGLSKHASGVLYTTADSGTSGYTQLRLGNTTATTSAGGKEGQIRLYGTAATYYVDLKAGAPSANRTITFPNATGTVALTSDIPTVSTGYDLGVEGTSGSANSNQWTQLFGTRLTFKAGTNVSISKDSSILTFNALNVPSITLNGSSTTSPSFYAPTSAGTSGYVLTSSGSGAPSWTNGDLTDTKVTVAENTKSTKYYPILATGIDTATRQIDTNDKNDSSASNSGLFYQNGYLYVPDLYVGDIDYGMTLSEYNTLDAALDAIT